MQPPEMVLGCFLPRGVARNSSKQQVLETIRPRDNRPGDNRTPNILPHSRVAPEGPAVMYKLTGFSTKHCVSLNFRLVFYLLQFAPCDEY